MIHFHIVTLFPESIEPYLKASMIGKAQEKKKIKATFYDPKDYTESSKKSEADPFDGFDKLTEIKLKVKQRIQDSRVDRRPYGGGPGMVMRPEPMLRAVAAAVGKKKDVDIIFFSPAGKLFDEPMAKELSSKKHIVFICGHYEGIDARVEKILKAKLVSVGPYVLTGGELPAATMIDAISRFVPGVLGKAESLENSRVSSSEVYTRPDVLKWKGKSYAVPEVLKSGNHAKIEEWKKSTRKT
jgi:tRNA (guanine37-N1)-methyltransferase